MPVPVDSNVLLDVLTENPQWYPWSSEALATHADRDVLAINPIIYAEISAGFARNEELEAAVLPSTFHRLALPWEAAFLAGGATEAKVAAGRCDAIVEVTETGSTIRADGLVIIADLMESNPQIIANKAAMQDPFKRGKIEQLSMLLRGALRASSSIR